MFFPGARRDRGFQMARKHNQNMQGKPESLQVRKSPTNSNHITKQSNLFFRTYRSYHVRRTGKTSASSSGSMTLEAAFVLPLILFFLMTLFSMFMMLRVQIRVQESLERVMNRVVKLTIYQSDTPLTGQVFGEWYLRQQVTQELEAVPEIEGLDFTGTGIDFDAETADIRVAYSVKATTVFFPIPQLTFRQRCYKHLWTGVDPGEWGDLAEEKTVYVAENGTVYHLWRECSYLNVSVRAIAESEVAEARNHSGEMYRACGQCCPEQGLATLYITAYGERYHGSLSCGGLKRTVRMVALEMVEEMPLCSRCAKKGVEDGVD